jgi:hypothetical protein
LQEVPLTAFEVYKYLLPEYALLIENLDAHYEASVLGHEAAPEDLAHVFIRLDQLAQTGSIVHHRGYYCLPGRERLIPQRLRSYGQGIGRERLLRRYTKFVRHIPFIRGLALGGSQAMGLQRSVSDIDLFIITDPAFLWLGRTFITAYFQLVGHRRHGKYIANRFCLNHYLAGARMLHEDRDLYNAMEYLRFRPLFGAAEISDFWRRNRVWMQQLYATTPLYVSAQRRPSKFQMLLEALFRNRFGNWLEQQLGQWQLRRIRRGDYVIATAEELSFHSKERKKELFRLFFESKKQYEGVTM